MKNADYFLIIGLIGIFITGVILVLIPVITLLDVETVTRVSTLYKEPIFITFNWIADDEIQVGKLITINAKIENLPYENITELKNIELKFEEEQINFWYDNDDSRQKEYPNIPILTYKSNDQEVWKSNSINLRFVTPADIDIKYCDYNLKPDCKPIEGIIHPAPYDLANRIDGVRSVIVLSLITAGLSSIVVWSRIKESKKNLQN